MLNILAICQISIRIKLITNISTSDCLNLLRQLAPFATVNSKLLLVHTHFLSGLKVFYLRRAVRERGEERDFEVHKFTTIWLQTQLSLLSPQFYNHMILASYS